MKLTALSHKFQAAIIQAISALLIILFVYAGISKFHERSFFEAQLSFYPVIGGMAILLSWLIPSANLFTALLLIFHKSYRIGFMSALIMLICYTVYLTFMIITQHDLPCSCGGLIKSLTWNEQVMFNLLLIALALTGLWLDRFRKSLYTDIQPLK